MIRTLFVKCKDDFKYCKRTFESNKLYKSYVGKSGYIVINNSQRVYFEDRRPGHLKCDVSIKAFRNHFEIVEEGLVHNKEELNNFIL